MRTVVENGLLSIQPGFGGLFWRERPVLDLVKFFALAEERGRTVGELVSNPPQCSNGCERVTWVVSHTTLTISGPHFLPGPYHPRPTGRLVVHSLQSQLLWQPLAK